MVSFSFTHTLSLLPPVQYHQLNMYHCIHCIESINQLESLTCNTKRGAEKCHLQPTPLTFSQQTPLSSPFSSLYPWRIRPRIKTARPCKVSPGVLKSTTTTSHLSSSDPGFVNLSNLSSRTHGVGVHLTHHILCYNFSCNSASNSHFYE